MRQIHVESVQSWANELYNLEKYGEYLEQMPASVLFDFEAVYHGHATLVTPDGRQWWIPVRGTVDDTPAIDDSAAVLESYLIDNKVLARKLGPRLPIMFFDAKTLDPTEAFCQDCNRWVDLSKDAQVFED